MKYAAFVLEHFRRGRLRTASTLLAMIVCIFLFCTLQTIITAVSLGLRGADARRLVVRNQASLLYSLPPAYADRLRTVPGVERVAACNFWLLGFGGSAAADFFAHPTYAIDAEEYLAMYPEYIVAPAEKQAFLADRRGCLVGERTARELGWKVGDALSLTDQIYDPKRPFDLVVRGIYRVDRARHPGADDRILFLHERFLREATDHRVGAGFFTVQIEDPQRADAVANAIDELFADSRSQTRTETESAFRAGIVSMAGNLARLLNLVTLSAIFALLVITANTMSMAVRERRREIAVLKTLGYGSDLVLALVLGEALALGVVTRSSRRGRARSAPCGRSVSRALRS